MAEQTDLDILLLDIGMPVLDGFAVARKIRETPRLATLPVLAITAYAMHGDREKILHAGFDGYLSKPINARALVEEMERLLRKRDGQASFSDQSRDRDATCKKSAAGASE